MKSIILVNPLCEFSVSFPNIYLSIYLIDLNNTEICYRGVKI